MQDFVIEPKLGSNLWSSCLSLSSTGVMGALLGLSFLCPASDDSCCFSLSIACARLLLRDSWYLDNWIHSRFSFLKLPCISAEIFLWVPRPYSWNGNWIASNSQRRGEAMSVWMQIIPGGPLCPHLQAETCCLVSRWLLPRPISLCLFLLRSWGWNPGHHILDQCSASEPHLPSFFKPPPTLCYS